MTWINVGKSLIYSTQKSLILYFLHETHSTKKMGKQWWNEWGGRTIFSHIDSASQGVCILTRNFDIKIHKQIRDTDGRYIILDATINDVKCTIANVYAPNDDAKFFVNFWQPIEQFENYFKIVGGDWNLALDVDIDKQGDRNQTDPRAAEIIKTYMTKAELLDIWRILKPDTLRFNWYRRKPSLIHLRLHYILILSTLKQYIEYVYINTSLQSDHSIPYLCLSLAQNSRKMGYRELNVSLLRDLKYSMKVSEIIREALGEEVSDIKHKWELMELKVCG